MATFSIKDKQIEALGKLLNFNVSSDGKHVAQSQDVWKVLVYDKFCSDIISLLLKKGDLRNLGITLHLLLHSERQSINDVPAIYFVSPSKDNVRRICEDCKQQMYDNFVLNFSSSIPRPLLEELATSTVQSESSHLITKVYDQYLNFLSLEKDLFALNNLSQSYMAFNDPAISDSQAEANIDATVDSLLSVLITLGVVPIIRSPRNNAAEHVARRLDEKLHQYISSSSGSASFGADSGSSALSSFQRPVLIILDRNIDLTVMLHHAWTYQALTHDLLNMNLNRVAVEVEDGKLKSKQSYDLDPALDNFWNSNAANSFTNIAVEVKAQIDEYKTAMESVESLGGGVGDHEDHERAALLADKTKGLNDLVSSIPELREKKRVIDMHTNIATALMRQIKDRELDAFFSCEEGIITKSYNDKKELLSLIQSENRGSAEDKVRLVMIYFMATKNVSNAEMELFEQALTKAGADIGPLQYFKKHKAFNESLSATINVQSSSKSTGLMSMITGTLAQGYQGEAIGAVGNLFSSSVRNLLPKNKDLYVTRVVDALMEMKNVMDVEESYLYFDTKAQSRGGNIPRKNTPFKEAIVFVVGGGNYVEYQNLQDYAKKQPGKKIIYGATELMTPRVFLQQLSELSKK